MDEVAVRECSGESLVMVEATSPWIEVPNPKWGDNYADVLEALAWWLRDQAEPGGARTVVFTIDSRDGGGDLGEARVRATMVSAQ